VSLLTGAGAGPNRDTLYFFQPCLLPYTQQLSQHLLHQGSYYYSYFTYEETEAQSSEATEPGLIQALNLCHSVHATGGTPWGEHKNDFLHSHSTPQSCRAKPTEMHQCVLGPTDCKAGRWGAVKNGQPHPHPNLDQQVAFGMALPGR
jgi:hypothetical protein